MAPSFPAPLHLLAILSLALAGTCAVIIALDETRRPQRMWIMKLVWPLAALFGSVIWLGVYYRWGRTPRQGGAERAKPPFPVMVLKGASHCGAGCVLGDIIAEWSALLAPAIAVSLGWGTLFADKMFAVWIADYLVAFVLGVAFQYFTITPMRNLSPAQGLWQAIKADTLSITSWQVGMYGVMALVQLAVFRPAFGGTAPVDSPEFWFVMQAAMLGGFVTAYPMNWWLIRLGVKEKM